ncbi:transposase [Streptomyces sp. NPDC059629]|uniref:IS701 family transposase n=1 Tax=Streptomyces sp. NPDC059629 TaxID=3346889 RepID=UPI00369303B5
MGRVAGRVTRVGPRRRVSDLVLGLLSDLARKNCGSSIAEWAGEAAPDGMQYLLGRAEWDAGRVRDDVRECVLEHLRDADAVLVVDEFGGVKKGTHSVGVHRRCTGTAGKVEHAQVAVCLVCAGARGHAAVDRESYIPRWWTCDGDRRRAAGLGEGIVFATRPEPTARVIGRFLDWTGRGHRLRDQTGAGRPGDRPIPGRRARRGLGRGGRGLRRQPDLRSALAERQVGYVTAVASSAEVATGAGKFRADGFHSHRWAASAAVAASGVEHDDGLGRLAADQVQDRVGGGQDRRTRGTSTVSIHTTFTIAQLDPTRQSVPTDGLGNRVVCTCCGRSARTSRKGRT